MKRPVHAAALALLALVAGRAVAEPAITPRPLVAEDHAGRVRLGDGTPLAVPAGDREAAAVARYLQDLCHRAHGPQLATTGGAAGPAIRFERQPGFGAEGYRLDIDAHGAVIAATSRAGLLYGAVSLWQLLAAAPDRQVGWVHVEDRPRFGWRGFMLDSVRHYQSPAEIVRVLDWMALHKLNRLQWHLGDDQGWRLPVPGYPKLAEVAWRTSPPAADPTPGQYGGLYTPADVAQVLAAAQARNITVVPEIELPGHATAAILAYPELGYTSMTRANLADWGIFDSVFGIEAPTFAFLHRALDTMMAQFPSHEIAIGGDEAVHELWRTNPAVQARMRALGLKDEVALQAWFVRQIGDYLSAHGRRLVGWDEILDGGGAPADGVVLSWHGAEGAIAAAKAGHDVVMASAPTLYLNNRQSTVANAPPSHGGLVTLADVYAYDPGDPPHPASTPALDPAAAPHILGIQAELWTEYVMDDAQVQRMALPRAAAVAEGGWTAADRRSWPSFQQRLPALLAAYHTLGLQADDGATAIQPVVRRDGDRAQVTLGRQLDLGTIRYTTDGSAPTPASAAYAGPLALALPARLRVVSYAGDQPLARALDLSLDRVSASRRRSQQLTLCSEAIVLNLPGRTAPDGTTPAYLLDIRNPCWIDRDADLGGVGRLAVQVAALPFGFQFANDRTPPPPPPGAGAPAQLVVRRGCDGPVLASAPLAGVPQDGRPHEMVVPLPTMAGRADLCLRLDRPTLAPLWALGMMELRP